MKRYDRITPEGTRDLLFEQCAARKDAESKLRSLFESRGFSEVNTPTFEFYDVFFSNARYFPQESMYKLTDTKGRILVIRPDSTIPIARVTSTKLRGHSLPIRLYYSQCIFRQGPALSGKYDEERQIGVELIGSAGEKADMDILSLCTQALSRMPVGDFRIEIGHIAIFKRLLESLNVSESEKEDIHRLIDAKNYSALNSYLDGLTPSKAAFILKELPKLFGGEEVFQKAKALLSGFDSEIDVVLSYLESVYETLTQSGLSGKVMIDFGLVNQAEYYSGIVFRGYLSGVGEPVLSGGRYDALFKDFGEDLPAVGFGMNLDLIADELLKRESYQCRSGPQKLVYCEAGYTQKAILYLEEMIKSGVSCEFSLDETEENAKEYAKRLHFQSLIKIGEAITEVQV